MQTNWRYANSWRFGTVQPLKSRPSLISWPKTVSSSLPPRESFERGLGGLLVLARDADLLTQVS